MDASGSLSGRHLRLTSLVQALGAQAADEQLLPLGFP